eukprot:8893347-Ditylum_brightwellii.AAC.1
MQEDAQLWSDLLWLTGGLLELDKYLYHFIWYEFLHDRTPVMQSTRPGPVLVIKQLNNKIDTEIQYKNPYTPHTTLGHLKAPGAGNVSQKALLKVNLRDMRLKHQQVH